MKVYHVYLLECSDKTIYTGVTNNLKRRLEEHHEGLIKSAYTFKRRPLKLLYTNAFGSVKEAITFEKRIQKWSAVKKRALAEGDFEKLRELAECKNESHFRSRLRST